MMIPCSAHGHDDQFIWHPIDTSKAFRMFTSSLAEGKCYE